MTASSRRVLVVTVVHRPEDARIRHRQIAAMLDAGWQVTYAAPFAAFSMPAPDAVRAIELPRSVGRRRLDALRAARTVLRAESPRHDMTLLHDPELLVTLPLSGARPVVWDVHEDVAASLTDRPWLPAPARAPLRAAVRLLERWAEHRCATLLLAEHSYAERFATPQPIVPNLPLVPEAQPPPPGPGRAVYVGRLSVSRGVRELIALGDVLAPAGVVVDLVGQADDDCVPLLADATARGVVRWRGFVPNDEALRLLSGATVGLSLLRDEPNFRGSMPTKVVEYLAHGLPVVTTPLTEAVRIVEPHGLGEVVAFEDVPAVADAVLRLHHDESARHEIGERAWRHARDHLDWRRAGAAFLAVLEDVARHG